MTVKILLMMRAELKEEPNRREVKENKKTDRIMKARKIKIVYTVAIGLHIRRRKR